MAGAFNQFATGIGNTDAGFVLGTGKILLKVPETMRFFLEGQLSPGVMAKDVILHVIGDIGFDGATYRAMQWEGPGALNLNMDDRMTITNMAIEAGGKNGIFPYDEKCGAYVRERIAENGTKANFEPVEVDREQSFAFDKTYDLSKLEPTVACHPDPGNRKLAREMKDVKLDRAYIGSCTGGKTSDFLAFATVVKGRNVKIHTFGVPATTKVVAELKAAQMDGKSVWSILENAGVQMTENASCAACLGGPQDTFGRMNEKALKCISATNRNFPGRMGHKESQVFLASPYTVAASALTGHITDPRDYVG
jgi:3-isopropylmalate/(R)-2-methylmalate dehydratase large subunit